MAQFKRPLATSSSDNEIAQSETPGQKVVTVYDAVAGNITQNGFLDNKVIDQRRANQPLRPDEVLFKKVNAPTRYEEKDYYFAHKDLPPGQELPSGDLLSAIHTYVSKLYFRTQMRGEQDVWRCMDETALIALGILIEETAKDVLGQTGDLALIEAARSDEEQVLHKRSGEEPTITPRLASERYDDQRPPSNT